MKRTIARAFPWVLLLWIVTAVACSLESSGVGVPDEGGKDATADVVSDVKNDTSEVDAGPDVAVDANDAEPDVDADAASDADAEDVKVDADAAKDGPTDVKTDG